MAVITISRQFGAGGRTLGKMIAEKMGYTFADEEILHQLAKEANVSSDWVEAFEQEAGSTLSKLIDIMVNKGLVQRVLKEERGYLDDQTYIDYLVLIVARIGDEGDSVILGRGSQYILNDHPDAYHFLLVDSVENRIEFMMRHYDISRSKAANLISSEDKRRLSLYRRLGKTDYDNPSLYHMVLNMGRMDLQTAADQVCSLVRK